MRQHSQLPHMTESLGDRREDGAECSGAVRRVLVGEKLLQCIGVLVSVTVPSSPGIRLSSGTNSNHEVCRDCEARVRGGADRSLLSTCRLVCWSHTGSPWYSMWSRWRGL